MRSEHRTTGDEWDLGNRRVYTSFNRAGRAKSIKKVSHRQDRRVAKRADIAARLADLRD